MRETSGELYIHETAVVDPNVEIGAGSKVWHFSHVRSGAKIGRDVMLGQNSYVAPTATIGDRCRIQNNVSLYDGVSLAEDVFVGPSVVFTNVIAPRATRNQRSEFASTTIGRGVSIGANATILCGVDIGEYAMIGAGCVVLQNVRAFRCVVGNPAREIGWVCRCGHKLVDYVCAQCNARYAEHDGTIFDV